MLMITLPKISVRRTGNRSGNSSKQSGNFSGELRRVTGLADQRPLEGAGELLPLPTSEAALGTVATIVVPFSPVAISRLPPA